MNPLKKPVGGLLSNPFGNKDKQESNPLGHRALDHKRHSKIHIETGNLASLENPSNVQYHGSMRFNPQSPGDSQSNPSRMYMNNPLKLNVMPSDEKRRGSGMMKQPSMEAINLMKNNSKALNFRGDNLYENFKHIIYEIERKDAKIHNLDGEVKNVKLAKDPKEIEHFKKQLNEAVKTFHAEEHRYNSLFEKNSQMKQEIETLKAEIVKKQPIVQRQQNFFKTVYQLQNEFNTTQSQLGELRGKYGNIVINDKIKIEQEFKRKMESQLFDIVLNVSKDNKNAEIQKIYSKIKGKKLAVSNLM